MSNGVKPAALLSGMIVIFLSNVESGMKEYDAKCRYSFNLPAASWLTAESVCGRENRTLAKISSTVEVSFVELMIADIKKLLETPTSDKFSASDGAWVGAFYQQIPDKSKWPDCKDFNYHQLLVNTTYTGRAEENLCIYMNYQVDSLGKFGVDSCSESKYFLCESLNEGDEICMVESRKEEIKTGNELCFDIEGGTNDSEGECRNRDQCYAVNMYTGDEGLKPQLYSYATSNLAPCNNAKGRATPETSFRRKRILTYHDPSPSAPATFIPIADRCPEPTKAEIDQKIDVIVKNLTVVAKETNKYKRTLTSAPDDRTSARNIGILGIVVLALTFGSVVLGDIPNLIRGIQEKCKKQEC